MKKNLSLFLFLMLCGFQAQVFVLKDAQTGEVTVRKDSLAAVRFLDSLSQNRFFLTKLQRVEKTEKGTVVFYEKGPDFNRAKVRFEAEISKSMQYPPEMITDNLDSLRQKINSYYTQSGYPFNKVQTKFYGLKNGLAEVQLSVQAGAPRKIDRIVVRGYEKIAPRFVKNLERNYKGKVFGPQQQRALNRELKNHRDFSLERTPEVLYTQDSTEVYLFLKKTSNNTFDGILGFGNDAEDKFSFNGNLNVNLQNVFNRFERISVTWQRNPDRGQTFDLKTDFPYLFNTNVGVDVQLNIFRQDSSFATAGFRPVLYYNLSNRQKIGFYGNYESSSVIQAADVNADFSKSGAGIWYRFSRPSDQEIFLDRSHLSAEFSFLNATYETVEKVRQQKYFLQGGHHFQLLKNHFIYLNAEAASLQSRTLLYPNELFRVGGWNSLRGFGEQSLLAKSYFFGGPEYRYLLNPKAFFDAFAQWGQIENNTKTKLYSLGLGFNVMLPIGLMKFQISNGNAFGTPFSFAQTKIHWGVLTRF